MCTSGTFAARRKLLQEANVTGIQREHFRSQIGQVTCAMFVLAQEHAHAALRSGSADAHV